MKQDKALDAYLREASGWDLDRLAVSHRSARLAWRIAFVAMLLTVASVVALMLLMPLKRVDPFVVRVDNTTGIVDVVPIYTGQADAGETVTRYLLSHYVQICERFNFATAESDYTECGAFHTAQRNQAWIEAWTKTNPKSPLNLYKDGSSVRVQVSAISFFKRGTGLNDLAQVRYVKAKRAAGAASEELTHWIATVQYGYAEASKDPRVRQWNPLGFKVIEFRPEPELQGEAQKSVARTPASTSDADPQRSTP